MFHDFDGQPVESDTRRTRKLGEKRNEAVISTASRCMYVDTQVVRQSKSRRAIECNGQAGAIDETLFPFPANVIEENIRRLHVGTNRTAGETFQVMNGLRTRADSVDRLKHRPD